MNGIRIRLETKPGKSFASAGSLPRSRASSTIAAAVSSEVCSARITSTSCEHGHRVEEVHADHAVGPLRARGERRDRDRRRVRGEDRARRAASRRPPGRARSSQPASSTTASIMQVGGHELVDRRHPREHVVRGRAALLGELLEAAPHRLEATLERRRGARSWSETRRPDAATTCAMPPPICPAPTTRTCSKLTPASVAGRRSRRALQAIAPSTASSQDDPNRSDLDRAALAARRLPRAATPGRRARTSS